MFDVIHNDGTLYTVYHIKENPITGIEFLVYDDSMGWIWENDRNLIPVEPALIVTERKNTEG